MYRPYTGVCVCVGGGGGGGCFKGYMAAVYFKKYKCHLTPCASVPRVELVVADGVFSPLQLMSESVRVCATMLLNNTETPITFRLKVSMPFWIVELSPATNPTGSTRALETNMYTLKPQHHLLVCLFLIDGIGFVISIRK